MKLFAKAVRGHWGIENTCHWTLDMTFREDESRTRDRHVCENLAWLRRFALGLFKQHPNTKTSRAMKRRQAGWCVSFFSEVLFNSTTEWALTLPAATPTVWSRLHIPETRATRRRSRGSTRAV